MKPQAGELRLRVVIQAPEQDEYGVPTQNEFGEVEDAWTTVDTVWAAIQPMSGRELQVARTLSGSVSHRIIIRYLAGLKPSYRIQWGTRYFSINSIINEDEAQDKITLYCTEVVDG